VTVYEPVCVHRDVVLYTATVTDPSLPLPRPRVVVLMPAYRAGKHVVDTFQKIPRDIVDEVIIVDDASPDDTFALAQTLPARVYRNEHNLGYGGNMKICLQKGLDTKGEVFVELHADGQYDPKVIPQVLSALRASDGMLLGSRFLVSRHALHHGMPLLKYFMNKFLTAIANVALGTHLTEFQSGFRVYTRPFLERANFQANSNDHLFSFETILQALYGGFTVTEIPVVCTYGDDRTQMGIRKGVKYTVEMLWCLLRYWGAKAGRLDPVFTPRST
jgi:glycosyltransferase involved in cell wall biosynthesis